MSERAGYSGVSICLHWLIALLIIGMIMGGLYMTRLDDDQLSLKFTLYQWHKSFGVTILLLTIARLIWRLIAGVPAPAEDGWRATAAKLSHRLLYALAFAIPLAGWAMVSASLWNIPTVLFDTIPWPHLPGFETLDDKPGTEAMLKTVHAIMAYGFAALIALHSAAALYHHHVLKDNTMRRMWFFRETKSR